MPTCVQAAPSLDWKARIDAARALEPDPERARAASSVTLASAAAGGGAVMEFKAAARRGGHVAAARIVGGAFADHHAGRRAAGSVLLRDDPRDDGAVGRIADGPVGEVALVRGAFHVVARARHGVGAAGDRRAASERGGADVRARSRADGAAGLEVRDGDVVKHTRASAGSC